MFIENDAQTKSLQGRKQNSSYGLNIFAGWRHEELKIGPSSLWISFNHENVISILNSKAFFLVSVLLHEIENKKYTFKCIWINNTCWKQCNKVDYKPKALKKTINHKMHKSIPEKIRVTLLSLELQKLNVFINESSHELTTDQSYVLTHISSLSRPAAVELIAKIFIKFLCITSADRDTKA